MPGRRSICKSAAMRPRAPLTTRTVSSNSEFQSTFSYSTGQQQNDCEPFTCSPHVHPHLPGMSKLTFEIFFLFYMIVALLAQYVYIFKTVWWYPTTLPPSSSTINLHLIDVNLSLFLLMVFSIRLLCVVLWIYLRPSPDHLLFTGIWIFLCTVFFTGFIVELVAISFVLLKSLKFYKLLFLLYPLILWIPYNFFIEEGVLRNAFHLLQRKNTKPRFQISTQKLTSVFSYDGEGDGKCLDAKQVRQEVQQLCKDFNVRFAEVVFFSLSCSYYAGLVPMFFTKSYHSYDLLWSVQHTALILINSFLFLLTYLLPAPYLQTLSTCATLLGGYIQVRNPISEKNSEVDIRDWSPSVIFPRGSYVRYKSITYQACGKYNTAIPDDRTHAKFFLLFYKPLKMLDGQLISLLAVIFYQIFIIFRSSHWDHMLAPAVLQFFSYYVLRLVLRDRIVLSTFFNLCTNV